MRWFLTITICALLVLPGLQTFSQEEEGIAPPAEEAAKEAIEAGLEGPAEEEVFEEEEMLPGELDLPEFDIPTPEEMEKMAEYNSKLTIDAVVVANYKYLNSAENYTIKYHINMGGEIKKSVCSIKGNAKVATDISGFLAKSPAFECLLKVSIAEIPYEITCRKTAETEMDINVAFKGAMLEDWESLCTFLDGSNAKFNTRGTPEKVLAMALEKAKPPLNKIEARLDAEKESSTKFTISKHSLEDERLGTIELDGTGVVTIEPIKPETTE